MVMQSNIISMVTRPVAKSGSEPKAAGFTISLGRKVLEASILQGHRTISDEALGMPRPLARNKDGSLKLSKTGELSYATNKEFANAMRGVKANVDSILEAGAEEVFASAKDAKIALDTAITAAAKPLVAADNEAIKTLNAAIEAAEKKAEFDRMYAVAQAEEAKQKAEKIAADLAELETLRAEKAAAVAATQQVLSDSTEQVAEVKGKKASKKELVAVA